MATKIMVIGESGSGKSTSAMNLDPKTTFYVNCIGKSLPFKGWKKDYSIVSKENPQGNMFSGWQPKEVLASLNYVNEKRPEVKTLIVDDAQYIMGYLFMSKALEKGFDKFAEMGKAYFDIVTAPDKFREDLTVIFLSHSEDISANGYLKTKAKTLGKMLDSNITIEGLFSIVLLAKSQRNNEKKMEYIFVTQSDGTTTAKSPMGMFDRIDIPNDLKFVLDRVESYNKGE